MDNLKKIFELLTPDERKLSYFLLILILIMAFIDMLGVASILPFVSVLTNPEIIQTNFILKFLYKKSEFLGVNDERKFLFLLGFSVFIFLILSLTFKAFTTYVQTRFSLMREYSIGKRLIEGYLSQPYPWFLNKNSSYLGKNILSQVNHVVNQAIFTMINLIAQTAVSLAIISLLIVVSPKIAIQVGLVLIFSYGLIFYLVKNFLSYIGNENIKANENRFTVVSEAFGSIKEIKFKGLEKNYIKNFSTPAEKFAVFQSLSQVTAVIPRFFMEIIAFGGIIILILYLMSKGGNFNDIIPIITLYVFAGYRLMPALQQIYYATAQIRFAKKALNTLHSDLKNLKNYEILPHENIDQISVNKNIILKNINYKYPNSKNSVLKGIDFKIQAFTKVGIVGFTGSGKTTLIDIILGLLEADQGDIYIDEKLISSKNKKSWQKIIGYVPQQIYLADKTVAENIAFGVDKNKIDQNAIEDAAKIANLHEFVINNLSQKYETIIGERGVRLSGGQRQRIGIARAVYNKPQVLILDEATSSLDSLTEKEVMKAINKLGKKVTIILIAHRLSTVKDCDKIFLLEEGKLKAEGSYDDLIQMDNIFKNMASI